MTSATTKAFGCPATVHGYAVIAATLTPGGRGTRPGAVIFVDRGEAYADSHRWITAWLGADSEAVDETTTQLRWDREWRHGHYFGLYGTAEADYVSRSRRGY